MQGLSDDMVIGLKKVGDLRYGENPHQHAALCRFSGARPWGLAAATLLHGKPLNYEHYINLEAASELVAEFSEPACAIVKHMNPAGVAESHSLGEAAKLAYAADPKGCTGGVAAFNREMDGEAAKALASQYLECIIASRFSPEALDVLRRKKEVRLVTMPSMLLSPHEIDLRPISGGLLIQDKDNRTLLQDIRPVSRRIPARPRFRRCSSRSRWSSTRRRTRRCSRAAPPRWASAAARARAWTRRGWRSSRARSATPSCRRRRRSSSPATGR